MTAIKMTEEKAMAELVGRNVTITRPTHSGSITINGTITTPLLIEYDLDGNEIVTLATVEGTIIAERIAGLPLPIEADAPIRLEGLPINDLITGATKCLS